MPIGTVGEICARGPSTMIEYYANPKATAETMTRKGGYILATSASCISAATSASPAGKGDDHSGARSLSGRNRNVRLEHPREVAVVGLRMRNGAKSARVLCVPRATGYWTRLTSTVIAASKCRRRKRPRSGVRYRNFHLRVPVKSRNLRCASCSSPETTRHWRENEQGAL